MTILLCNLSIYIYLYFLGWTATKKDYTCVAFFLWILNCPTSTNITPNDLDIIWYINIPSISTWSTWCSFNFSSSKLPNTKKWPPKASVYMIHDLETSNIICPQPNSLRQDTLATQATLQTLWVLASASVQLQARVMQGAPTRFQSSLVMSHGLVKGLLTIGFP